MLELLHIENIAVIEEADIQFRPGFNALTGETGAGKSIVIDAMGAVLGGRTSRDLIRTGTDQITIRTSTQHQVDRIHHDGFARAGFAGHDVKAFAKLEGQLLNQGDIFHPH